MDLVSFLAGALSATLIALLLCSQRHRIRAAREGVTRQAGATRERITRSADAAYRSAVTELANSLHLAAAHAPLEALAVEPRFLAEPQPFDPLEPEDPSYDRPHHLVPFVPDWPYASGPYHPPAIPLTHLLSGSPRVALLGLPGSGRTVSLAVLALRAAQEAPGDGASAARLPVYLHLADLALAPGDDDDAVDPLQPLLEAARPNLRGLAARLLSTARTHLRVGRARLLADGWDEIGPAQQARVLSWLDALMRAYPGNQIVVTAGIEGCAPLKALGFAVAYVAPWSDADGAMLAGRWAAAWPKIAARGRSQASRPSDDLVRQASRGNRGLSPLDVTLRIWALFAGDDLDAGRPGWYRAYVERAVPDAARLPALYHAAERLLGGQTSESEQETLAEAAGFAPSMFRETVLKSVRLAHPALGGYLAARALSQQPVTAELADHPQSRLIMPFLAAMSDITPAVEQRLSAPAGLLASGVMELAAWAADADSGAAWRAPVFTRLSQILLRPVQYPALRERAMAALVASRDANVSFVFLEGLKSENPELRLLCALGLGALGDGEMVVPLAGHLEDADPTVEASAALALGALGARAALSYLIQVLLTGNEFARRAAAEMLGVTNLGGEGHDVLREASDEVAAITRRAAVYGLARVDAPWAAELLATMERRDEQWVVRAAAGSIMDRRREGRIDVKLPGVPARPEETRWLADWLAGQDEPGSTPTAQHLGLALAEGDEVTRLAAVEALGAESTPDRVPGNAAALYAALRDAHPEIRDSAFRALGAISLATGQALPAVM